MAGIIARSKAVDTGWTAHPVSGRIWYMRDCGAGTFRIAGSDILAGKRAVLGSEERQPVRLRE